LSNILGKGLSKDRPRLGGPSEEPDQLPPPLPFLSTVMSSGILGISKQVLRLPASQKAHQLRLTPLPPTLSLSSHSLSPPSPLLRLPRSYTSGRRALPQGFTFYPSFFSRPEQEVLLESALIALDKTGVGIRRVKGRRIKRRKEEVERDKVDKWEGLQGWFMHAGAYEFQEGHFDGVIKQYREALVKEGSLPDLPGRESPFGTSPDKLMERLEALFDGDEQGEEAGRRTLHVLHLGEEGSIQGHVDSQIAMGETIVGVSLGAERVLLLEKDRKEEEEEGEEGDDGPIEVLLPSGSVYVQR
jgi:alkylated DNA repair protein alkB family protein 7